MTFSVADRVQETVTSPGTATLTLLGAVSGFQSFSTGIGANNTCYYVIADQIGINWEVGYGTVGATGTTLARTTVLASSTGGALVSFSNGTQNVWVDYPASKAVYKDASGNVSLTGLTVTSLTDTGLTSGRVTFASTGGLLADSANLTFDGTTLTSTKFAGAFNGTLGATTPSTIAATTISASGDLTLSSTDGNILAGTTTGRAIWGNSNTTSYIVAYGATHATLANNILFANNANTMIFNSSGNLGLGVIPRNTNASVRSFELTAGSLANFSTSVINLSQNNAGDDKYITTAAATTYQQTAGQHRWYNAPSGTAGNAITFTQAMTLDASGNLGIGTTSPAYPLDIGASTSANAIAFTGSAANGTAIRGTNTNSSSYYTLTAMGGSGYGVSGWANSLVLEAVPASTGNLVLGSYSNSIVFQTGGRAERMRIDASGNLLVGKTSASNANIGFQVDSTGISAFTNSSSTSSTNTLQVYSTGAGAYRFYVGMDGVIHATSIVITAISDERLKENIKDIDTGLDTVMALKPRRYDWKEGKGLNKKNAAGFIAQEFEAVFPDSVGTSLAGEDDIEYKNINYEELIPTLVKAIQELKAEIDLLKGTAA